MHVCDQTNIKHRFQRFLRSSLNFIFCKYINENCERVSDDTKTWFILFLWLCHLRLAITLNFQISKVAYSHNPVAKTEQMIFGKRHLGVDIPTLVTLWSLELKLTRPPDTRIQPIPLPVRGSRRSTLTLYKNK